MSSIWKWGVVPGRRRGLGVVVEGWSVDPKGVSLIPGGDSYGAILPLFYISILKKTMRTK